MTTWHGHPVDTCASCLAWGHLFARGLCAACYMFGRKHPPGPCQGCARHQPLRNRYCRLCWDQARTNAHATGNWKLTAVHCISSVTHHQLFFANMLSPRGGTTPPRRYERRGRPRTPTPPPATQPQADHVQLMLFTQHRGTYLRFGDPQQPMVNPWTSQAHHLVHRIGEARGWSADILINAQRALTLVLANHVEGDKVTYSALFTALRPRFSVERAAEVLQEMGIFVDDRRPAFETWLDGKLAGLPAGFAEDIARWIRGLHHGGPRREPRTRNTTLRYLNAVRPLLLTWSTSRDHLREVTHEDILTALKPLHGDKRHTTLVALRSLFATAKKNGVIFRNPTSRVRVGERSLSVLQPLTTDHIERTMTAAARPADPLILALATIHAARAGAIRDLLLDDVDLGNRRLTIAGRTRPLDEMTRRALLHWLDHRRTRWPTTANPHLLVNMRTALGTGPVGGYWLNDTFRGYHATLDRLRMDRQLEEALTHQADPLHLALVFGIDEKTAIRYANSARQLLATAAENDTPS